MKSKLSLCRLLTGTVVALMIAACGSNLAHAAAESKTFVSSDNKVFSLENVKAVESQPGVIVLTFTDNTTSGGYLADNTGSVYSTVLANIGSAWAQAPGANKYYNPLYARYTICNGTATTIGWFLGGAETVPDAGCVFFGRIKAVSHP
jgi:hypothetical protein